MNAPEASSGHWSQKFLGRKAELDLLLDAWAKVRQGNGPQFVLLLGDTGLGKTRLVHEFYYRISEEENQRGGSGYWPDRLSHNFRSLEINPQTFDKAKPIPWLWWGIRWEQSHQRNVLDGQGLLNSAIVLERHSEALVRARELRTHHKHNLHILWEIATFLPYIGHALHALKFLKEGPEYLRDQHRHRQAHREAEAEAAFPTTLPSRPDRNRADLALQFATAFLDPSEEVLPSVPFILVLDDAQMADALTLGFVEKLYRKASEKNWPLLVVVTHWLREWKERRDPALALPPEGGPPQNVNQLIERLFRQGGWLPNPASELHARFHPREVGRLPECPDLLAAAFPGVAGEAHDHILRVAHGNPKLLVDFLLLLEGKLEDWAFEEGDRRRNLTARGLALMKSEPVEHEKILSDLLVLIRQRDPDVITALSLGSQQGMRFLHDLVTEVAQRLHSQQPGMADDDRLRHALDAADTRLNLVSNESEPEPNGEFREFVVQDRLRERFAPLPPEQLRGVLLDVLRERVNAGRLPSAAEAAGRVFQLLLDLLEERLPAEPALQLDRLRALARYALWLEDQDLLTASGLRLEELDAALRRSPEVRPTDLVSADECLRLAQSFVTWRHFESALQWCRAVETALADRADAESLWSRVWTGLLLGDAEMESGHRDNARQAYASATDLAKALRRRFGDSPQALRGESLSLDRLGDIDWSDGNKGRARGRFGESLRLCQAMRRQFGDSPLALQDESVSLNKLGDIDWAEGNKAQARGRFEESLKLRQAIRRQFGDSPEVLRGEAASLARLGDIDWAEGNKAQARGHFEDCLKLCQAIRRQFGDSPQALRHEAVSLNKLADIHWAEGNKTQARGRFEESLNLCQSIRRLFGDSPQALQDEALSLERLGDIDWAEGNKAQARGRFEESLKLRQAVRRLLGDSPQALRDESLSLEKLGNIDWAEGNKAQGRGRFEESLKLRQAIRRLLGDSLQALRDESVILVKLGNIHWAEGNKTQARGHFEESLNLCQAIRRQFGDSPEALRDEAVSLVKLGNIDWAGGNKAQARGRFEESFNLCQAIRRQFGDSPQALRDEAVSLNELGDMDWAEGNKTQARGRFEESLKLCQAIRRQFGGNPEALRDEAASLVRLGDVDWAEGNRAQARARFEESLKLCQAIRRQFCNSPQALRDEAVGLERIGDIDWAEGNKAQARGRFEESLKLKQAIRRQFGDSPEALRGESVSLERLGDIDWAEGNKAQGRGRFEESLKLRQAIRRQFGDSPQALRDEAVSWTKFVQMAADEGRWAQTFEALDRAIGLFVERLKRYPPLPEAVDDYGRALRWGLNLAQQAGDAEREQAYAAALKQTRGPGEPGR